MKTYILHWTNGDTERVTGNTPQDVFERAWYRGGAVYDLDWIEEVKT